MELWIRSQDRKHLMKPDHINFVNTQIFSNTSTDYITIGIYKSEERALEVLDEIQNILGFRNAVFENTMSKYNDTNFCSYVYEMPKE